MNKQLRANKQILRTFMRESYTTERLLMLLDHARSGKLAAEACCCFIGIVTADHPLAGIEVSGTSDGSWGSHYGEACRLPHAKLAEAAFIQIDGVYLGDRGNAKRSRLLIPMILAELRRRAPSVLDTEIPLRVEENIL